MSLKSLWQRLRHRARFERELDDELAFHLEARREHLIRNGDATFIFKVKGDSMVDAGIYEGDALLIDRSIEPRHGNIVLAVLNNDFTVKRLHKRGGVIQLVPENRIYPTISVKEGEEFSVWGVVTYNLHKLY